MPGKQCFVDEGVVVEGSGKHSPVDSQPLASLHMVRSVKSLFGEKQYEGPLIDCMVCCGKAKIRNRTKDERTAVN
jgi:hypothetical protein